MKKVKNFIVILMLSLTLFNSVFYSYSMTVQAAEAIPVTMSALEAFLSLFGLELGLGNQSEFFSNSEFSDFVIAVAGGETVTLEPYGEVNFSDGESILAFMTWASALTYSVADGNVMNVAKVLDSTSYKTSGTSATSAMEQKISNYVGDYNGSSEALAEDVQSTFRVITGGGSGSDSDDEDDEDDNEDDEEVMTPKRWDLFTSIMSTFLFGASEAFNGFIDKFSTPEETGFTEYSTAFEELPEQYFNGSYTVNSDGKYVVHGSCYNGNSVIVIDDTVNVPIVFCYDSAVNGYLSYRVVNDSLNTISLCYVRNETYSGSTFVFYPNGDFFCNVPIYTDQAAALAALQSGDFSDAENVLDDSAYPTFRKTAPTATSTLSDTINKWMDTNPAIDDFPAAVSTILDASDPVAGTSDAVPAVNEAIAETAGVDIDSDSAADDDSDSGSDTSTNYFGILGKILAVLQSILNAILGELLAAVNAIQAALDGMIEDAFVPDEEKVNAFVDDFHGKFGFVDDMKINIANIEKYVFGVEPSPILKIPIMKVNSEYDYGFGDYFIIDVSWYEPYRPYGDLVILAFAWLMFIWRVFVSLPGIITGAPGSIWSNFSVVGTQPAIGMNDSNLIEDKRRK